MGRLLLVSGGLLVVAGLLWPWLSRLPLGRLPGDLVFRWAHTTVYLPLTTMVLVSVALSVLLWLLRL